MSDPADAENPGSGRHAGGLRSGTAGQLRPREWSSGSGYPPVDEDYPPVDEDYGGGSSSYPFSGSGHAAGTPYGGAAYDSEADYGAAGSFNGTSSLGGFSGGGSGYANGASSYAGSPQGYENGTPSYSNGVAPYPNGTSSYVNGASSYPNGRAGSANGSSGYPGGASSYDPGSDHEAGYGSTAGYDGTGGGYDPGQGYGAQDDRSTGNGVAPYGSGAWSPYDGDPPAPAATWSPYDGSPPPTPQARVPHPATGSPYSPPTGTYSPGESGARPRYDALPPAPVPVEPPAGPTRGTPAVGREPYPPAADRTDPRYGTPGSPLGPPTPIRGPGGMPPASGLPAGEPPVPRHSSSAMSYRPLPGTVPDDDETDDAWSADEREEGTRRLPLRRTPPPRTGRTGSFPMVEGWPDERPGGSRGGSGDDARYDEPRYDEPRYDEPRYDEPRYDEPRYDEPRHDEPRYSASGSSSWSSGQDRVDRHESGSGSGSAAGRGPGWARGTRRPAKKQTPLGQAVSAVSEIVVVVALALTLALVIKTFLVQAFFIPSESMENTLLTGDRVLVSKLTPNVFDLHRGDIVVFRDPGGWLDPTPPVDQGPVRNKVRDVLTFVGLLPQDSGEHLIKRVIGLPGDKVSCAGPGQPVKVNGAAISEPYVYPGNTPSDKVFDVTVPEGHLWVMGDHRAVSEDSRFHPTIKNGMVPITDVVGKAFVLVWPLSRASTLGVPGTVFARVPEPTDAPVLTGP